VPLIIAAAVFFDFFAEIMLTYAIAIIHEFSHVCVAKKLGIGINKIEIFPFGVTAQISETVVKKPHKEIIIAITGPISNIILAIIGRVELAYNIFPSELIQFFITINLAMLVMNLLPILPLDGGRIMRAIFTMNFGTVKAYNFSIKVTRILSIAAIFTGITILIFTKFNFSLLIIGVFLLSNTLAERNSSSLIAMRGIIYTQSKVDNIMRGNSIVAKNTESARKLLKNFSYNHYSVVSVLDERMNIGGVLTESQIIDGLVEKGSRVKLSELI
jgi:stage IV sporulation protein FB